MKEVSAKESNAYSKWQTLEDRTNALDKEASAFAKTAQKIWSKAEIMDRRAAKAEEAYFKIKAKSQ